MKIRFHELTPRFGDLVPYSNHPITIEELTYKTPFHYVTSVKFAGNDENLTWAEKQAGPSLFREQKESTDPNWDKKKDQIMKEALRARCEQHKDARMLLLLTGWADLEFLSKDSYWGLGTDKTGQNRYGELLEEVRAEIRDQGLDEEATKIQAEKLKQRHSLLQKRITKARDDANLPEEIKKNIQERLEKALSE